MNIRNLKDSDGNVFSPKVSADSVYLSGSTENLTTKLSSIPTKTSQLTNDSGFATGTIPTKTSQLTNDSGFITGVPSHTHPQDNNFIAHGNEFIFVPTLSGNTDIYFNYRQTGGNGGGVINSYRFCNGTPSLSSLYASGYYVESSRKVKENIKPTEIKGEDMINSVNIVDFNYISDTSKSPKVGFIAEDTDPLFSTRERKAMDSANCIGILMKAVQELSSKVKNLTSELETLRGGEVHV